MAAFLAAHGGRPDAVLFNGGFFESPVLRERFLDVLGSWYGGDAATVLDHERLDLAVALGAARFGLARRGVGLRISGGLARAYYLGVRGSDGQASAVCLAPTGLPEGAEVDLMGPGVRTAHPPASGVSAVRFQHEDAGPTRRCCGSRSLELTALPPVRTVLRGRPGAGGQRHRARARACAADGDWHPGSLVRGGRGTPAPVAVALRRTCGHPHGTPRARRRG